MRAEHRVGDLVVMWYEPPSKDLPGFRGFAQIAVVNGGEGNVAVRFGGRTSDRRHHEGRPHMQRFVFVTGMFPDKAAPWDAIRTYMGSFTNEFETLRATHVRHGGGN